MIPNTILRAKIHKDVCYGKAKEVALLACGEFERCTIEQGVSTGAWLTVMPTHDKGMMLSPREWRNVCFLCYARTPQTYCQPATNVVLRT